MTADLHDMRSKADVLDDKGTDLSGIAGRARGLTLDGDLLWSTPFSPGSAAQAERLLVEAAFALTTRTLKLEGLALLLRTKAELIETADEWKDTGGRVLEQAGGTLAGAFAVPLALTATSAGVVWFGLGTVGEAGDSVLDALTGKISLSELDDRLKAAPGDQLHDMQEAAILFLRDHPGSIDAITGGLPGFLNGAAGPLAPLVPDDYEGVLSLLLRLGGPHGVLDDRPVQITGETRRTVSLHSLEDLWNSANALQSSVQADAGASAVRISKVVVDGQVRWVVQVPGTQQWDPSTGGDPSDLTTNVELMDDGQARINDAVLEAMRRAHIPYGQEVMLMGHSQGGIAAASIAANAANRKEFSITTVFTGGSPIGRIDMPAGVTVVALEHEQDPVPRLDSEDNPDLPSWTTVHRDLSDELAALDATGRATSGDDYLPDPIAPHGGKLYAETAGLLDAAAARARHGSTAPDDLEALRVVSSLAPFLGDASATDYRLERTPR